MAQLTSMLLNGEPPASASSREGLHPHPRDPVRPSGSAAAGALPPPGRRSGTGDSLATSEAQPHPGVELRANIKSISHRCHLFEVAFVWELTKETIHLPLGCLQGGQIHLDALCVHRSKCTDPCCKWV